MASIIGYVPGARNECGNPGFEGNNVTGWAPALQTSWAASTEQAWEGLYSGKYVKNATGGIPFVYGSADPARVAVVAGDIIQVRFRIKAVGAAIGKKIRIQHNSLNAANGQVNTRLDLEDTVVDGTWQTFTTPEYTINGVSPVWYAFMVRFDATTNPSPWGNTDTAYLDGIDIRKNQAFTVDSYVAGNQGTGYTWVGTPNASKSDRAAKPIYGASGRGGQILLEPQLFKADKFNNIGEEISPAILSGMVELRTDREIKMQFKGNLIGLNPVAAYSDYLAPFMKLSYPDGTEVYEQIGLFSIAPPGEEWNEEFVVGSFQGYDLTWNLQESSFGVPFTVATGTNIAQSMRDILNNEGLTRWNIPDNSATFTTARTWETDKSKLAILNDHAEAIGYYTLHTDRVGQIRSFPYNNLESAEPATLLYSGSGSTVIGAIIRERLPDGIINMVRVLKEGAADGTISYTQTNANPLSRVSTVSLGRIKFKEVKVKDLASLAVAQQIARKALSDAASAYTRYQIKTVPDPTRNPFEIYDTLIYMKDGTEVVSGKVRCTGWDIGFTPQTAEMTHYCNREEPYE
jgi:hypothetical protein